ncbi:trypsin-like serine peptidase [Streptomyces sp. NPDC059894]|uniref:trypsin-like serine peptidase n=1 Tax=unclassified Streptomyces TaxID=2593676 RepID=UPI0036621148
MPTQKQMVSSLNAATNGERPLMPSELTRLRPVLGTGERPAEMVERAGSQRIHVLTDTDDGPPEPEIGRVEGADGTVWHVDVPVGTAGDVPLPGRTATQGLRQKLLSGTDHDGDAPPHRPEWLDLFYVPRVLPSRRQKQKPFSRLDGDGIQLRWVIGPDNRQELNETSWPWGCVGKIFTSTGWTGSGALVGRRVLLTAGHVVPWADVAAGNWWMRFVPAFYDGTSLHGAGVQSYVSDVSGFSPDLLGGETAAYDRAVCRLYEPLGDQLGYFGMGHYIPAWTGQPWWTNMGYPHLHWLLGTSYESGISVHAAYNDINGGIECHHYGDITPGASGGPMFAFFGEGNPRIIAVQSSDNADISAGMVNYAAGGPGLVDDVIWARQNWT